MAIVDREMWMILNEDGTPVEADDGVMILARSKAQIEAYQDIDGYKAIPVKVTIEAAG